MRNVIILGACMVLWMACTGPKPVEVSPEEDAYAFVVLTDVVPEAIRTVVHLFLSVNSINNTIAT